MGQDRLAEASCGAIHGNDGTTIENYHAGIQFDATGRTFDVSLAESATVNTATNTTALDLTISATGTGCGTGCLGEGGGGVTFLGSEASHAITTFGGSVRDNGGIGNIVDGVVGTSLMENIGSPE